MNIIKEENIGKYYFHKVHIIKNLKLLETCWVVRHPVTKEKRIMKPWIITIFMYIYLAINLFNVGKSYYNIVNVAIETPTKKITKFIPDLRVNNEILKWAWKLYPNICIKSRG